MLTGASWVGMLRFIAGLARRRFIGAVLETGILVSTAAKYDRYVAAGNHTATRG